MDYSEYLHSQHISSHEGATYSKEYSEESYAQYNFTIHPSNIITHAVLGNFLSSGQTHIAVARGNSLGIMEVNFSAESVSTSLSMDVFGIITNLKAFTVNNESKDAIVFTSDAGKLIIMEYIPKDKVFNKLEYAYGYPCCGLNIPIPRLGVDTGGRAILLSPAAGKLILLHKLQENKFTDVVLDTTGYEIFNIVSLHSKTDTIEFAVSRQRTQIIKAERIPFEFFTYKIEKEKELTSTFELFSRHIDLIVPVPYNSDSPGGVVIFSRNEIYYRSLDANNISVKKSVSPKQQKTAHNGEEDIRFVCASNFYRFPELIFFAQTTQGKIFSFNLWKNCQNLVKDLRFEYLDTLPEANSLCVLQSHLFLASKFSNHFLFKINRKYYFRDSLQEGEPFNLNELKNFKAVDILPNAFPSIDFEVADLVKKNFSQIYLICGKNKQASLKRFIQGFQASSFFQKRMAFQSCTGAWMCCVSSVFSIPMKSSILCISTGVRTYFYIIKPAKRNFKILPLINKPGFHVLEKYVSLVCASFGKKGMIQIAPSTIHYYNNGVASCIKKTNRTKRIKEYAINQYNIVIYQGLDFIQYYRFVDGEQPFRKVSMSYDFQSFFGQTSEMHHFAVGKVRDVDKSPVIAFAKNNVVYLAFCDVQHQKFIVFHNFKVLAPVNSLVILTEESQNTEPVKYRRAFEYVFDGSLDYLLIGLKNGNLLSFELAKYLKPFKETIYNLGKKPVELFNIKLWNSGCVIAASSKNWLYYFYQGKLRGAPLDMITPFEYVMSDCPEMWQNCIVTLHSKIIKILFAPKLEHNISVEEIWLDNVPQKLLVDREKNKLFVMGRDRITKTDAMKVCEKWISCIEVIDVVSWVSLDKIKLPEEMMVSCAVILNLKATHDIIIVGGMEDSEKTSGHPVTGVVITFRMLGGGKELQIINKFYFPDVPTVIHVFKDKILIARGNTLELYIFDGMLIKRHQIELFDEIVAVDACQHNNTILVGHASRNISVLQLTLSLELALIFKDHSPVSVTSAIFLKDNQYAISDKHGNVLIVSQGNTVDSFESLMSDLTGDLVKLSTNEMASKGDQFLLYNKLIEENWKERCFIGTSKLIIDSKFYVGDPVVKMQMVKFHRKGNPCLLYVTNNGSIGVLLNISKEAKSFLDELQNELQKIIIPLSGCDLKSYRSCYGPVKNVIDGDFCSQFITLPEKQKYAVISKIVSAACKDYSDQQSRNLFIKEQWNRIIAGVEMLKWDHFIFL